MSPRDPEKLLEVQTLLDNDPQLPYRDACARVGISYRTWRRYAGKCGPRPGVVARQAAERRIPKPELERELLVAAVALLRVPTSADFATGQFKYGHGVYFRTYGSWDAALEAAGLPPIRWREVGLPAKMRLTAADLTNLGLTA